MSGQSLGHERAPSAYERCPHGYLRAISRAVPRSTGRSVLGQCTVDGLWCVGWVAAGWPFEPGGDLGPAPCPARSGQAGTPCCPQTRMIRAVVGPRVRPGRPASRARVS